MSKVIIIGAGLTGILAAIELNKLGYDIQLMEQAPQLRYEGGGLGIWPPGVAILQAQNLLHPLHELSGSTEAITLGDAHGETIVSLPLHVFDGINGERNIFVVRKELQDALAQKLPVEKIIFNKKCINVTQHKDKVQAHFTDDTSFEADFLIAADGIFSKVRRSLAIEAELKYTGIVVVGGIVNKTSDWHPKHHFMMEMNRLVMLMPVGKNRYYTFMARPLSQEEFQSVKQDPLKQIALFSHVGEEVDTILMALKSALQDEALKHHYFCQQIYDADPMPQWSQERVVLLGEAAHPIGPLMGLGTSFCFQGVMSLMNGLQQYPQDLTQAFAYYQKIQSARLQHMLAFERLDEANLLNEDPTAFAERLEVMRKTSPQELFAPLITALSYSDEELLTSQCDKMAVE